MSIFTKKEKKRVFYYGLLFTDAEHDAKHEIPVEVVASDRETAEIIGREALGKDSLKYCKVTNLVEMSIKALVSLKDEATEIIKMT